MSISEPIARTSMLIRRPVADVFEAFVDPAITAHFWFTRGSKRLVAGEVVTWSWDMYGVSVDVSVEIVETNRRIRVAWPAPVEWDFASRSDGTTYVTITASGFSGTENEQVAQAIDSMGGFSFALAGCKAWLEHGIELNLVADHNPNAQLL
jgi:uncharacterized protein YndB with AHSA1/START domain